MSFNVVTDLKDSFNPYPKVLTKIKSKKHKQTKATEISKEVKKIVWE